MAGDTAQFDLFGGPAPATEPSGGQAAGGERGRASRAVAGADVPAPLQALARRLPAQLHLGTSSWAFPGWAGIVYDREHAESTLARQGLAAYAAHPLLRCVGVDRTFYAPIDAAAYRRYAEQTPPGFGFVVKAPMVLTRKWLPERGRSLPSPAYLDAGEAMATFVEPALGGLGDRLGALVFQFPPQDAATLADPPAFAARLHEFFRRLPRGPLLAVELRDRALLCREYAAALDALGVRHCVGLHPGMPRAATQARVVRAFSPGPLVVRWNLNRGFAYEAAKARYRPFDRLVDEDVESRAALAALAADVLASGQPVWITANNKAEGSAPLTLFALAEEIERRASASDAPAGGR